MRRVTGVAHNLTFLVLDPPNYYSVWHSKFIPHFSSKLSFQHAGQSVHFFYKHTMVIYIPVSFLQELLSP